MAEKMEERKKANLLNDELRSRLGKFADKAEAIAQRYKWAEINPLQIADIESLFNHASRKGESAVKFVLKRLEEHNKSAPLYKEGPFYRDHWDHEAAIRRRGYKLTPLEMDSEGGGAAMRRFEILQMVLKIYRDMKDI